jgi:hypothetical protein
MASEVMTQVNCGIMNNGVRNNGTGGNNCIRHIGIRNHTGMNNIFANGMRANNI